MMMKEMANGIFNVVKDIPFVKSNKKIEYLNVESGFDIESTSTTLNNEKVAFMYTWCFGIGKDNLVVGRTWDEFIDFINEISSLLELSESRRLVVYVHNLAFEFQFFRKYLEWESIFALDDRKPVKAVTKNGIEFRCSLILSGLSLEQVGKRLIKYPIEKLVGDLDYKIVRHQETPITEKEWRYIANDVKVILHYIRECIEDEGDITGIPLTKTGYVRRYCKKNCLYGEDNNRRQYFKYRQLMDFLTMTPDIYSMCKRAFQGGFTHADSFFVDRVINNVASFDITSSYPTVMISELYPMTKGKRFEVKSREDFEISIKRYCCIFDIEFIELESKVIFEHPLSVSKCKTYGTTLEDNGRIVSSDRCITTITEVDFEILQKFYSWKTIRIGKMYRFRKQYLPKELVKSILKLYRDKTQLKDIEGQELDYQKSKEQLNSAYGMIVTDPCREIFEYDDEWSSHPSDIEESIKEYNTSKNRFLYYPWGIYVTAYARRRLFQAIYTIGTDYIYSDTDSIKFRNIEKWKWYFEKVNKEIVDKLDKAMEHHKLSTDLTCPINSKGIPKQLGVFDFEGIYDEFKTLGSKRYAYRQKKEYSITIAGLGKKNGVEYIRNTFGDRFFDAFTNSMHIPSTYNKDGIETSGTGKNIHTYLDDEFEGEITDYNGIKCLVNSKSSVHLEGADYSLKMSDKFVNWLLNVKEQRS